MKTSRPSSKPRTRVIVEMAWWWPCYAGAVVAFCRAFNCYPNIERVTYWARRAVRVRVVTANAPFTFDA